MKFFCITGSVINEYSNKRVFLEILLLLPQTILRSSPTLMIVQHLQKLLDTFWLVRRGVIPQQKMLFQQLLRRLTNWFSFVNRICSSRHNKIIRSNLAAALLWQHLASELLLLVLAGKLVQVLNCGLSNLAHLHIEKAHKKEFYFNDWQSLGYCVWY